MSKRHCSRHRHRHRHQVAGEEAAAYLVAVAEAAAQQL